MKSFMGIGEQHSLDSSEYVLKILQEHQPEAITLERQLSLAPRMDTTRIVEIVEKRIPFSQCTQNGYHHFNAEGILISMREDCPATLAVQRYALKRRIPFYFVDWSGRIPDRILKFKDGMVRAKFLGKESYKKLLPAGQTRLYTKSAKYSKNY